MPVPALTFDTERTPTEIIVCCSGRITLDTVALFQNTIRDLIPESRCITVDLTHVSRMDSAGVGALAGAWSSARRKSAEVGFRWPESHGPAPPYEVKLVNFNEYIRTLLRIARLDKVFGISQQSPDKEERGQEPV